MTGTHAPQRPSPRAARWSRALSRMRWARRLHRLHWIRWLRWLAPIAVLALAAALRLWALARPGQLVFDEIYYVRDAVSQLAHGFPTTWPNDDAAFTDPHAFSDHVSAIAHSPLGKWLIGLGILALGPETGWGWRISSAVAGVAAVAVTMRLGYLMGRSMWVACLAGLLLAVDGVHVVLSRVGLLDGFLTLLVVLGALFVWHDQAGPGPHDAIRWKRPWLLAAGVAFGAAAAVKWSGLYPLAAFLLLITARDVILRVRAQGTGSRIGALLASLRQALVAGAIALPAAVLTYLATWIGWILHPAAQDRRPGEPWWVSLWEWHTRSLAWHASLTAEHPYQSSPLGWPLALRPTAMYRESIPQGAACPWAGGCVAAVAPLPNPLVTWAGVLALLFLCWIAARALWRGARLRGAGRLPGAPQPPSPADGTWLWVTAFVLTGYFSGWLPWVLTFSRSAVFQFYAVVLTPFAALALALVLGAVAAAPGGAGELLRLGGVRLDPAPAAVQGRRVSVVVFVLAALVLAVLFFPLWSGMPVAGWFWRAHIWLPGWS